MSDPVPPYNYGAVVNQVQPGAPPASTDQGPPPYSTEQAPPGSAHPEGPPPSYEPSKQEVYPPQGTYPTQGAYPPQGAYPTQGSYPQPGVQPGYQTSPVQQTIIVNNLSWSSQPQATVCPYCHATVTTSINHTPGGVTWLAAGLICIVGCWLGCCLIPFCVPDLQDVEHSCPNCNKILGYNRKL